MQAPFVSLVCSLSTQVWTLCEARLRLLGTLREPVLVTAVLMLAGLVSGVVECMNVNIWGLSKLLVLSRFASLWVADGLEFVGLVRPRSEPLAGRADC